jgi:lipoprotein-anchoring transpeptidase ErfK/SrfK
MPEAREVGTARTAGSERGSPEPSAAVPLPASVPPAAAADETLACERIEESVFRPSARAEDLASSPARRALFERVKDPAALALLAAIPETHIEFRFVQPGENLSKIAKANRVTVGLIRRLNALADDRIRAFDPLAVPHGPFRAVIDRSAYSLSIFVGDSLVKKYAIGVGRDGSTPAGEFLVLSKVERPEWTSPAGEFFPSGDPANPLGSRWIGVTEGYGIHGTTDPTSIGKEVSRGCVRMENWAVEEVYDFLTPGARVRIE